MVLDSSTLLAIFLLVCVASLASYLFSRWLAVRTGRAIGWAGIGIGTIFLLAAAVIAVLSTSWLSTLRWSGGNDTTDRTSTAAQVGDLSASPQAAHGEVAEPSTQAESSEAAQSTGNDSFVRRTSAERSAETQSAEKLFSSNTPGDAASLGASPAGRAAAVIVDPWAATRCVRSFHPDPADLERWSIENECLGPVAVLIATCLQSADECNARQAASWKYQRDAMVLPAKGQRPVSSLEDTVRGRQVRSVACLVTTPVAIRLIGSNSETRSSTAWREQFEAARENDECLARVQRLADAGAHSGASIDALLGGALPKSARPMQ